ncbi:Similar to predicted protein [Botryotinia fuckeliana B05.10]; acc. no. XP_001545981 [Pyronema omphalodes CBS 100304]|uniref:Uncharacterized protein n=1 Tax=Pyronema omphalodes (strain CBS 100304) TaxID=1076935 RepID=U4L2P6_PYROM|nr:Similar to predicted protein [Botryotinia fuckeliana B05.10]; acc. no. XP_001545981 [Pyronema omphalodes CBS 100304]
MSYVPCEAFPCSLDIFKASESLDSTYEQPTHESIFGHIIQPVEMTGVPGVRCPKCLQAGVEKWVIRGKCCPNCGTVCV